MTKPSPSQRIVLHALDRRVDGMTKSEMNAGYPTVIRLCANGWIVLTATGRFAHPIAGRGVGNHFDAYDVYRITDAGREALT